ncbi:hypothetical protein NHQ30_008869 [Ciborinia camelliae]|nr:hypothetical protein NHQ30_008869 [Ciborinia camelliae]
MATTNSTLFPKISGKPKNLLVEFSKYQRTIKTRRASSISLTGTVKLHGTHTDILIHSDDRIQLQSRNWENFTLEKDSYGFVTFIQPLKAQVIELKKRILARFATLNPKAKVNEEHPLIIAGEWIGPRIQKDVAISALPERYFVIISVSINGEWQPDEPYADIEDASVCIVNISRGGFYHETVLLRDPDPAFAKMQALADAVEMECPFAKSFGIIGMGEGIVWKPAAPLCHEAKYWIKLKGPVSMGTVVAGPAARIPQRGGFVVPIFSNPASSPAVDRVVSNRPMGNVMSQRSSLVTPIFSPKKIDGVASLHSKSIQSSRPALAPKKIEEQKLLNLRNIEHRNTVLLSPVSKKIDESGSEKLSPTLSFKSISLSPEMIQQAKLEILSLIQSQVSLTRKETNKPTLENVKPVESDKPTAAISEEVEYGGLENEETSKPISSSIQEKASEEIFPEKAEEEIVPENLNPSDSPTPLQETGTLRSPTPLQETEALSPSNPNPNPNPNPRIYPPLILLHPSTPSFIAARNFAHAVIPERRLQQGWQYLMEMRVPTDRNGGSVFLKWLWHDVAIEERAEIEELQICKGLLKKEVERIGRDWYFEELALEEHRENWGVGAERY